MGICHAQEVPDILRFTISSSDRKIYPAMAPSATSPPPTSDPTILALRKTLCSENEPLARRFRALFSLKHLACQSSDPAIQAIAADFASPSALLKHELAYCLGQTKDLAAVPFLTAVLENKDEDPMCRHEAAEALGAIGDMGSLDLLKELRDRPEELVVVKETCEIAVARIAWENSEERKKEKLQKRYVYFMGFGIAGWLTVAVISHPSTPRQLRNRPSQSRNWKTICWIPRSLCSYATELCLVCEILPHHQTFQLLYQQSLPSPKDSQIHLPYSDTRLPLYLANCPILLPFRH